MSQARRAAAGPVRLCTVLLAAALLLAGPARALPSAVSINQCTDGLLARLADPGQVLGLSPYARDPARSWSSEEARRFPSLSGTAEEVLVLRPDLVFAGRFTKRATRELLRAHGIRVVEFEAARSLAETTAQIREAGLLLGHPERAEAAVARIDEALARLRRAAAERPLRVLPLQRRGWVAGGGTLLTSLIEASGLRNAGGETSRGIGRFVTLEAIVALRPDVLLVSETGRGAEDQGSALLQHPALLRLYPPGRRIVLPEGLNILCGGPTLDEAIDGFAAAILERRS